MMPVGMGTLMVRMMPWRCGPCVYILGKASWATNLSLNIRLKDLRKKQRTILYDII